MNNWLHCVAANMSHYNWSWSTDGVDLLIPCHLHSPFLGVWVHLQRFQEVQLSIWLVTFPFYFGTKGNIVGVRWQTVTWHLPVFNIA